MTSYLIIRDGEIRLRVRASVDATGYLIGPAGERVIDGELAKADGCYASVVAMAKARRWETIDRKYWLKPGTSPSGAVVVDECTWRDQQHAAAEAAMTPGQRAWRDDVQPLESELDCAEHADYYDPARICGARLALQAAVDKWRETYPADAANRDADRLISQAEHEEHLAQGALVYDADGWLDRNEQQRRHDEHMCKARDLRAQAASLRGKHHVDE